jgi:acyl CoA:acetate/3-ketoacid CoA transferase alpha subunit
VIHDQLIGAGCARRVVFSWGGNPGVGSLHRFRDAVQNQWPVPLEVEERSHAGMANRYVAGASGLPFAVLRGYVGTDLRAQTESIKPIAMVLPTWAVDYVAEVPGGAHPSYARGYYERDNAWYQAWDEISRDRDRFQRWLETDVLAAPDARRPR